MGFAIFGWTVPLKGQMDNSSRFLDFFKGFQSSAQNSHLRFTVTSGANVLPKGMLNSSHARRTDRDGQFSDIRETNGTKTSRFNFTLCQSNGPVADRSTGNEYKYVHVFIF